MIKTITSIFLSLVLLATPTFAQRVLNKSPKAVAQKFYQAWHLKDRKSALKIADRAAVNKLFSTRWRVMRFEGCSVRDGGGFECIYRGTKLDLSLAMIVDR